MQRTGDLLARSSALFVHASVTGHTRTIAERLAERTREAGFQVRTISIADASRADPSQHDVVVMGGCVRYGRHDRRLLAFIDRHSDCLRQRRLVFFSVDLTARDPERRSIDRNVYVRKFLQRSPVRPDHVEIIAGLLDYPGWPPIERALVRLIMKWTDGPTDPGTVTDYTDWDQVDRLADTVSALAGSDRASDSLESDRPT